MPSFYLRRVRIERTARKMNYEDFLKPKEEELPLAEDAIAEEDNGDNEEFVEVAEDIDVQKAVVEELAADKALQDEKIVTLEEELKKLRQEISTLKNERDAAVTELTKIRGTFNAMREALEKTGDVLAANSETQLANKVALLDRNYELPDRFPGETRDQVLEVIKEARDIAEEQGRIRRAQILESVLAENESSGNLQKKRAALEKFFNDNQNILSGPVIEMLERCGISYKHGEEYLLPAEILKRTY